jgi:hypothetical protein
VTVLDVPRKFSFALMALGKNWCDWVFEIEPTATGCRVTHSWIDHRGKAAGVLGRVITGVADRSSHNRRNMETTLGNLERAATARRSLRPPDRGDDTGFSDASLDVLPVGGSKLALEQLPAGVARERIAELD